MKWIQIKYQIWYRIKSKIPQREPLIEKNLQAKKLEFYPFVNNIMSYQDEGLFSFINLNKSFEGKINWNYNDFGKLWTYNLNYFDFLNQKSISKTTGLNLIEDYIQQYPIIIDGKESYPSSLRIINWIKFISHHNIDSTIINQTIYRDTSRLEKNLEFHLLANHLLENAFALFLSGLFFEKKEWLLKGKKLLNKELNEQILADGAHYELSPMYHQLMLLRVLDSIQFLKNNLPLEQKFTFFLIEKAQRMQAWLNNMSFNNGEIPLVNDAAKNINPSTNQLNQYAKFLEIPTLDIPLSESQYQLIKSDQYQLFIDFAEICPPYQPGHAHADTFNYLLHIYDQEYIVDSGTSTYENNSLRFYQRSTASHNTVTIGSKNSSDVWSSFRVGRRAKINYRYEAKNKLSASHNGYRPVIHNRTWEWNQENIIITDKIIGANNFSSISHIHFHPQIDIISNNTEEVITSMGKIKFQGATNIQVQEYTWAEEFNKTKEAKKLTINFESKLETRILI